MGDAKFDTHWSTHKSVTNHVPKQIYSLKIWIYIHMYTEYALN